MGGMRQQTLRKQVRQGLAAEGWGEALATEVKQAEPPTAKPALESPASAEQLMEEVCDRENLTRAWKRVRGNKGSPGVDGMTIDDAKDYLREHWPSIRLQLLKGAYQPQPVKRIEIPKPDGGIRKLGVPTVVDRLIQQALLQVLQERWDPTFSEHSYGFRPGRSAHQAVAQAQRYIAGGYSYVVDFDLEKFFDRVNHDSLMARVAARVSDKRVLKLIRAFLNAGVMEDGLVRPVDEGTPQGGPLSPLLSNLVLDDLDKELERRGHRFCRYADDCNIYVRSCRAGERVMASISRFLTKKLRLKVNETKSAVARPEQRKFRQVQGADTGHDAPDPGAQPGADDRRTEAISYRVARLLRLLPDPTCAHKPGSVDSPKITLVSLAAVAERAQPLYGTAPTRRSEIPSGGRGRFTDGILANVRTPGRSTGSAQSLLRFTRSPPSLCWLPRLNLIEPPRYGPVCPVVGEGWRREASPYPDH
jgi:group II intron reverse transcriptase/maturase